MFDGAKTPFVVKNDGDVAQFNVAAARVHVVGVVPAVLMKRAADQGFPEHELHLRLAHPGFQLRNHFARDEVPLMHVGAVNVAVEVTAGKQGGSRCESKKGSAHGHGK